MRIHCAYCGRQRGTPNLRKPHRKRLEAQGWVFCRNGDRVCRACIPTMRRDRGMHSLSAQKPKE